MSITHWPANRRKLHRGLPKSNSRALPGPGTRRLRFEVLETRALLDAGGGLLPGPDAGEPIDPGAAPSWTIVPGKVLVGLRTDGRIDDVGAYAETLAWPGALGPVGSGDVEEVYTIPKSKGQFLTIAKIHLAGEIDVADAVADKQLPPFSCRRHGGLTHNTAGQRSRRTGGS